MAATAWAPAGPARFGLYQQTPSPATSELTSIATPSAAGAAEVKAFHPNNPLLAFGALAAVTFGLMAFSTSVRVGHAKAAVSIGSTS